MARGATTHQGGRYDRRLALAGILLLAALLRLLWIDAGWFGADQARDLEWARTIATGSEYPLVGPLMRGRVHLGALYYYFWAIPSFVSTDVRVSYGFAALLGVAAVAMTYTIGAQVGGVRAGLLAALLLATSPLGVIDARVAWAPAALPVASALLLLAVHALLRRATAARAALVGFVAALATQLHLAAAPLLGLAAGAILVRRDRLGLRGVAIAAAATIVPLLPMALAWQLDSGSVGTVRGDMRRDPSGSTSASANESASAEAERSGGARDPAAGRLGDIIAINGAVIDGMTATAAPRGRLIELWILLETFTMAATIVAALLLVVRATWSRPSPARVPGDGRVDDRNDGAMPQSALPTVGAGAVLAAFFLPLLSVAVLPAEAWYYYLDTTLVPGCVLLALAVTPPRPTRDPAPRAALTEGERTSAFGSKRLRIGVAAIVVLAGIRTAGLLDWIAINHDSGVLRVSLERLRLGGADANLARARARLPTLGVKQRVAAILVDEIGIPETALRERVHGAAFGDVDNDNGFVFRRAAEEGRAGTASRRGEGAATAAATKGGTAALVLYDGDLPASWTARFQPPRHVGSLDVFVYAPLLHGDAATLEGCTSTVPPKLVPPDPRDYGFGAPSYPIWPCPAGTPVRVRVPVAGASEGTVVRVLARTSGGATLRSLSAEPPGAALDVTGTGAAAGVALASGPAVLTLEIELDGAAALDLIELHGVADAQPSGPSEPSAR